MDSQFGDRALFDGGTNAPAVVHAEDRNALILIQAAGGTNAPDHRLGDEFTQIGLFAAVRITHAVEVNHALSKDLAVFRIHGVDDGLSCRSGLFVLFKACSFHQEIVCNRFGLVINDDDADILQSGTGRLNWFSVLAACHDCMGMCVDHEINVGNLVVEVE